MGTISKSFPAVLFTPESARSIIAQTRVVNSNPDPVILSGDLNEVIATYHIWRLKEPSFKQRQNQLDKLAKLADRFAKALSETSEGALTQLYQDANDDIHSPLIARGVVREANECAEVLARWADSAKTTLKSQFDTDNNQTENLSAEAWLVSTGLYGVYDKHYQGRKKISQDKFNQSSGPRIRFIMECLSHLGIKKTPDAIGKSIERHAGDISEQK